MFNTTKQWYNRLGSYIYHPYAELVLGFLFYLEAIFFLPTDPMLIVYCVEQNNKALRYALIATIASVLGGITSYYLGFLLWEYAGEQIIHNKIVNYIVTPATFSHLAAQYRAYDWIAILIAGFTPVPYKAATLTAGFCKLSLFPFILCSVIARGGRFFLLAYIIRWLGKPLKESINRYFAFIMLATIGCVIVGCFLLH